MKIATTLIATVLALPFAASAKDGGLTLEQVPAKVAAAIQAAAGKEAVKIKAEKEDGAETYEAAWTAGGTKHEIDVAADGTVLLREDVITLEAAPAPVQEAIKKLAGKLEKVEQESGKKYTGTVYEAEVKTADGKLEVKFDATGKEIERDIEKEDDEKENEKEDGDDDNE